MNDTWPALLDLDFESLGERGTVLRRRYHEGPLLAQKALYPEGPEACHVTVLHPPSGIAGGDTLAINVSVGTGAHAVISTPGATRWYKSAGRESTQQVHLQVAAGGLLDWLPQENIVFENAVATSGTYVSLASGARAIGWEITQFGSVLTDGHWHQGSMQLDLRLDLDGLPVWLDTGRLEATDPLRHSLNGLAGFPVTATLWAFGPELTRDTTDALAGVLPWNSSLRAGLTHFPELNQQGLSLVRVLGHHAQDVRALLVDVWIRLRPLMLGVPGRPLRIWST